MKAKLPEFLRPRKSNHLVRIGKRFDGGYLVDARDVAEAQALLSFGIGKDWSFERGFMRRNNVPLWAHDASVSARVFLRQAAKSVVFFNLSALLVAADYFIFFRGHRRHVKRFVGAAPDATHVTIQQAFDRLRGGDFGAVFVKIDVEGAEYGILDQLCAVAHRTSGLVVEFHDVGTHLPAIRDFLGHYPLHLIHVHCNNFVPPDDQGVPHAVELSFTAQSDTTDTAVSMPNALDMPCSNRVEDYLVEFAGG